MRSEHIRVPRKKIYDFYAYRTYRWHCKRGKTEHKTKKLPYHFRRYFEASCNSKHSVHCHTFMYSTLFYHYFVQKMASFDAFNSRVLSGQADEPTDGLTEGHTLLKRCENASKIKKMIANRQKLKETNKN